jgi:hypothetical protein
MLAQMGGGDGMMEDDDDDYSDLSQGLSSAPPPGSLPRGSG